MALYLFNARLMATVSMAMIPIANMVSAVTTNDSALSPIDAAARSETRVFVLYVSVLLIGALVTAGMTVWLWKATSRYNEAVKKDADARIEEAKRSAAEATQKAGEANERAGNLEKEAETLKASNLRLEAAIDPRRLTKRQQDSLASLTSFAGRRIGIKSYSSDTEGLVLATQIIEGLERARIGIQDNRLTMQPAGSVQFGVSVEGSDAALVAELKHVLSLDGNLMATSAIAAPNRGFSTSVRFGEVEAGTPPAATITIGVKPIK